jgi:hypothetical protein
MSRTQGLEFFSAYMSNIMTKDVYLRSYLNY